MDDLKKPTLPDAPVDIGGGNQIQIIKVHEVYFERREYTPATAQAITAVAQAEATQAVERTKQTRWVVTSIAIAAPLMYFVHEAIWPIALVIMTCFGTYAVGDVIKDVVKSTRGKSDSGS